MRIHAIHTVWNHTFERVLYELFRICLFEKGWRLSGELLKRLWSGIGDIVRGVRRGGRCLLVLRCRQFFARRRINAGTQTGSLLARLLDVHQPGVFAGDMHIFIAWLWGNAGRRVRVSGMEHRTWLGIDAIVNAMHSNLYNLQNFSHTRNYSARKYQSS